MTKSDFNRATHSIVLNDNLFAFWVKWEEVRARKRKAVTI